MREVDLDLFIIITPRVRLTLKDAIFILSVAN